MCIILWFEYEPHVVKGVTPTYSSSRCRCESTMVTEQRGWGWEGSVDRRWILCSCCALLSQEMSCADPSNTSEGQLCTPMRGSLFCPDKNSDWQEGIAGICPPQMVDSRDKWSWEPADQSPAKSTLHLERREGKTTLGMHDRQGKACTVKWNYNQIKLQKTNRKHRTIFNFQHKDNKNKTKQHKPIQETFPIQHPFICSGHLHS